MTKPREIPEPKTWQYTLADGWTVYAGKTDEDNDLLSCHFARPQDYWFHVSGCPGSHVILRGPDDATASKELLQAAAAIAAWHSKARNGGNCSVDCTLARYVSKPPRTPAGLVTISNSKTIRVRPGLPG